MSHDAAAPESRKLGWLTRPLEFALKWGLLGASVLLLIYAAAKGLGAQFEIREIFGQQVYIRINNNLNVHNEKLANLEAKVEQLTNNLAKLSEDIETQTEIQSVSAVEILDIPSEDGIVTPPVLPAEPIDGEGYIWIGSWDQRTTSWTDGTVDQLGLLSRPGKLNGQQLLLVRPVNVREKFPEPVGRGYYKVVPSMGIADKGETIVIISEPRFYLRGKGAQIWVKVRATYEPKQLTE